MATLPLAPTSSLISESTAGSAASEDPAGVSSTGRASRLISIGICAWNEELTIGVALESLFRQSLFAELGRRGWRCEIICVANACTDRTAAVTEAFFAEQRRSHPQAATFTARVIDTPERGKLNACNRLIHDHIAPESVAFILMDADIVLQTPDTLWNLHAALAAHPEAHVAVDEAIKDIALKPRKRLRDRLSLGIGELTQSCGAQVSAQLFCIRMEIARRLYFPRDLPCGEDALAKCLVCTDFLTRPTQQHRVVRAPNASHMFAAYTSIADVLRNQKRRMMGQAVIHLLVDDYLAQQPDEVRKNCGRFMRQKDRADPQWLKRLIAEHLARTKYFWRLFPGIPGLWFRRAARIQGPRKILFLPVAMVGTAVTLTTCWMGRRALVKGALYYWPAKADAAGVARTLETGAAVGRSMTTPPAADSLRP